MNKNEVHVQNVSPDFGHFKKLLKSGFIYAFGNLSNKMATLVLIPVYASFLSVEEYGIRGLTGALESFLLAFATLGFTSALIAEYYSTKDENERKKIISTSFFVVLFVDFIICLAMLSFSGNFSLLLFHKNFPAIIHLFSIYFFPLLPFAILTSFLRAKNYAKFYSILNITRGALRVGGIILFLVLLKRGLKGVYMGDAIVSSLFFIVTLFVILNYTKGIKFSIKHFINMAKFGFPLIPAQIFIWLRSFSDRIILNEVLTLKEVGTYSFGASITSILSFLIIGPLTLTWLPFIFSIKDKKDKGIYYSRGLTYYLLISCLILLLISVPSKEFLSLITKNNDYIRSYILIAPLGLSIVLYGTAYIVATPFNIFKKTFYISIASFLGGFISVISNIILVPIMGIMGAALSAMLSNFFIILLYFIKARNIYHIRYEFKRIFIILFVSSLIYTGLAFVFFFSNIISILIKIFVILIMFPSLLFLLSFFKDEEKNIAIKLIKRFRKRGINRE